MSILGYILFFVFFIAITSDLSRIASCLGDILEIIRKWDRLNDIDRMEKRVRK